MTVEKSAILDVLKKIEDPDLHRDIVSLGFITKLDIDAEGRVAVTINLTTPACPIKQEFKDKATELILGVPGVIAADVQMTAEVRRNTAAPTQNQQPLLPRVKHVIAVGSGKGGVGKSTVAVNIAIALQRSGALVGLLDADIYGPSQPMMLGRKSKPTVLGNKMLPLDAHGLKFMSVGLLLDDSAPVIWRGPMAHGAVLQFLRDVEWGELDYLIVDLPPGTGDVVLTLSQSLDVSGAVVVCTPQDVALLDARKAVGMFEKVRIPMLGIVENMSYHTCTECGHREEIFAHGGARKAAQELNVPFLGEIPIELKVRVGGDAGKPVVVSDPNSSVAKAFTNIAENTAAQVSIRSMEQGAPTLTIH